jgi:hypothetical protein
LIVILGDSIDLLLAGAVAGGANAAESLLEAEPGTRDAGSISTAALGGLNAAQGVIVSGAAKTTPAYFTTSSARMLAQRGTNPFQARAFANLANTAADVTGIGNADLARKDSSRIAKTLSKLPSKVPGASKIVEWADTPVVATDRVTHGLGRKAQKMGLVFARPNTLERAAAKLNRGGMVTKAVKKSVPVPATVGTLDVIANTRQNKQIAKAVDAAFKAGKVGDEAVSYIAKNFGP